MNCNVEQRAKADSSTPESVSSSAGSTRRKLSARVGRSTVATSAARWMHVARVSSRDGEATHARDLGRPMRRQSSMVSGWRSSNGSSVST